jgi:hypothetical protein
LYTKNYYWKYKEKKGSGKMKKKRLSLFLSCLLLAFFLGTISPLNSDIVAQAQETDLYRVESGDTMYQIAGYYHINLEALVKANPQIRNPHWIFPRELLSIPYEWMER